MGIGIFFGILLILAGIGLILKIIFNIDLPVFKILIAFLFIYIGLKMLLGDFKGINIHPGNNACIFGETYFKGIPEDNEYTVIFGHAKIDLTEEKLSTQHEKLKINTIFGGCDLILNSSQPVKIKADVAFGAIKLPDKNESAFGKVNYTNPGAEEEDKLLNIESSTVFGEFQAILK